MEKKDMKINNRWKLQDKLLLPYKAQSEEQMERAETSASLFQGLSCSACGGTLVCNDDYLGEGKSFKETGSLPPTPELAAFFKKLGWWEGGPRHQGRSVHRAHGTGPHWDPKASAGFPSRRHIHHPPPPPPGPPGLLLLPPARALQLQGPPRPGGTHDSAQGGRHRYGAHGATYRYKSATGRSLPLFYIYDSYLPPPEAWAHLLTPWGSHSVRRTPYDGVFIALLVEEAHKRDILTAGFDGMYTYFASNGFSFGSSHRHWQAVKGFCDAHNLLFIPSVGPGYADTGVRPWDSHGTRNRVNGECYETAPQAALTVRLEIVSITSFNEWHEGTQIETAVPKKTVTRLYLDYLPHRPNLYLQLTRRWAERFDEEKERWLV
ncbi:glycoprotein endo-alpha-1,2-mannosidase-like protein [Tachyglossus aculeatus]|uniref:glycoprotein endo-alpha-1,2-mannosidase-like protein n=1 Tax=Tachyglossus aculeatus TaxID=9261 RepID=UPI0018F281B6|nr:glycoprotein endo-alpha-1,2-mannosidase-like protein [Tachyglossus aculeatus]